MKPNFLFHVPGTKGMFELNEIQRRTALPKKDPDYMRLPAMVEIKDCKNGTPMGTMPYGAAVAKFA